MEIDPKLAERIQSGIQYRAMNLETRADEEPEVAAESYVVTGYATTFDNVYRLYGTDDWEVREQVDAHAFDDAEMEDVIFQYNHVGRVFARTRNNTLTVKADDKGLFIEADLGGTEEGRKLYDEIKGGYTDRMSFGFTVKDDRIEEFTEGEKRVILRTITQVGRLYDVSAVSFPANDDTEISARSYFDGIVEAKKAEAEERTRLEAFADEIRELEASELEGRKAALTGEELRMVTEELESRRSAAEAAEKTRSNVADQTVPTKIIRNFDETEEETRKMFDVSTKEYRDAFYAVLAGTATAEQRALTVDNSAPGNGDALVIPKSLDEKIWDNIHTAHPIMADIATVHSGMAIEVTKHVAIATRTSKKLDKAAAPAEEENTFVKVVLYGYDYEKYVELTYAQATMGDGLEDYLAQEISDEIGESLAKDVFAQIEADAAAQQVTDTGDMFADIKAALAMATIGGKKTIYAPSAAYYEIVGAIKQGSPFNIAATLGCEVKLDDAAAHVTVVAPRAFLLNEVQPVMIESDRDVKAHKVIISGYLRAQGTLRQSKAAAFIA